MNASSKKVNWGIVSAGRISHTFARDIEFVENANVAAVAARNLDSAKEFAQQYGIGKAYQGYDALFADPEIDAVYISTPHTHHFQHAKAALLAGKHVLCEKPITITVEQVEELATLAQQKQLFLMEAMWTYFLPAIKKAKQWIAEGRIGKLKHIKGDFGYPVPYDPTRREWNNDLAGGCVWDMGIYPVAFNYLFNDSCDYDVQVFGRRAANGADSDVTITYDYGDKDSVLNTSFECRLPNWGFLVGTEGYIAIPDFFRASECSLHVLDDQIEHFKDARDGSGFEFEIAAASNAILAGELETAEMPLATSIELQKRLTSILRDLP